MNPCTSPKLRPTRSTAACGPGQAASARATGSKVRLAVMLVRHHLGGGVEDWLVHAGGFGLCRASFGGDDAEARRSGLLVWARICGRHGADLVVSLH
mgnify:CR=1 FL=1